MIQVPSYEGLDTVGVAGPSGGKLRNMKDIGDFVSNPANSCANKTDDTKICVFWP